MIKRSVAKDPHPDLLAGASSLEAVQPKPSSASQCDIISVGVWARISCAINSVLHASGVHARNRVGATAMLPHTWHGEPTSH